LKDMAQDEIKHSKLVPNAVYPGAFQEHEQGLKAGELPKTTEPAK
jgi:hypothetical protein